MNSFARYLGNTFETVEVLKSTGQSFVALVYDKTAQRLCVMKRRSLHLREIYRTLKDLAEPHVPEMLIDFGIARKFKPESRADTEILGTRGYASPEQFGLFDCRQTDARSDIYSPGITIKQLLGEDYRGRLLKILNRCTALSIGRRNSQRY